MDREGRCRTGEAGAGPTHGMCLGGCRQPLQGVLPSTRTFACVRVCLGKKKGGRARAEQFRSYFQARTRQDPKLRCLHRACKTFRPYAQMLLPSQQHKRTVSGLPLQ